MGWHIQYDGYHDGSRFVWDVANLFQFTDGFWEDHGLAVITDIAKDGLRGTSRSDQPIPPGSDAAKEIADHLAALIARIEAIEAGSEAALLERQRYVADIEGSIQQMRAAHEHQIAALAQRWALEREAYGDVVNTLTKRISALEGMLATIRDDMVANEQTFNRRYRTAIRRQQS